MYASDGTDSFWGCETCFCEPNLRMRNHYNPYLPPTAVWLNFKDPSSAPPARKKTIIKMSSSAVAAGRWAIGRGMIINDIIEMITSIWVISPMLVTLSPHMVLTSSCEIPKWPFHGSKWPLYGLSDLCVFRLSDLFVRIGKWPLLKRSLGKKHQKGQRESSGIHFFIYRGLVGNDDKARSKLGSCFTMSWPKCLNIWTKW